MALGSYGTLEDAMEVVACAQLTNMLRELHWANLAVDVGSCSHLKKSSQQRRRVRFADEASNCVPLEEVVEVVSFKNATKFSRLDYSKAEAEWISELLAQLDAEEGLADEIRSALARLEGVVVELALREDGCEVVQRALEVASSGAEQEMLVSELRGHVRTLVASPYGSDVLRTCLEVLTPALAAFVVEELDGVWPDVARSEWGHRVACKALEELTDVQTASFVAQLTGDAAALCCDAWASSVLERVLELGTLAQQQCLCEVLVANAAQLLVDRRSRRVVKQALELVPKSSQVMAAEAK